MQHLNGAYEVEVGDGGSRDLLLKGRKTYLVIDAHRPQSFNRRTHLVCFMLSYQKTRFFRGKNKSQAGEVKRHSVSVPGSADRRDQAAGVHPDVSVPAVLAEHPPLR